ncbi:MAG TPA: DUF4326 domain-containing protein [Xanthobacteraceae bacterium]|nr:DUF4326 domain-containing protein [Xanthobacteraceae bacterium]
MPERIQLSRAKGWRMPPNTVRVDRSGKWGNPYSIGKSVCSGRGIRFKQELIDTPEQAVAAFRRMLSFEFRNYPDEREIRAKLRGKNLGCWCAPDQPCHADVLLEIANQ